MDSGALISSLIDTVLEEQPLPELWAAELEERSQIFDILIAYILSPSPAPPNSLAELLTYPAVSLLLDSVPQ